MNAALALLRASHFPQTLAMTVFLAIAAAISSVQGWQLVLFVGAVLSGQLSVGWMNDFVDAKLDQSVSRSEKPVVTGALSQSSLKVPIAIALVLTIPLSILAAGWIGGLAHVGAVASAHVYNFYLSRTIWSWLPYVVSFALLPLFVAQAASNSLFPEPLMIVLFALVGFIAHLLNALPDIEIDRQAGKGGLAVSLGRKGSLLLAVALVAGAVPVFVFLVVQLSM
jgi:4-hydroxybenzoate polyprenyltransferase